MKNTKYTVKNPTEYSWNNSLSADVWGEDVSDGYHTMTELYNHRHALFCALIKVLDSKVTPLGCNSICWKSKLHSDGTMYEGWFIAGIITTNFRGEKEQISYHLPLEWWSHLYCIERENAPVWDGHTPDDVLDRLLKL